MIRLNIQRLADMKTELERELSGTPAPAEPQHVHSAFADEQAAFTDDASSFVDERSAFADEHAAAFGDDYAAFGDDHAAFGDEVAHDQITEPCRCGLHDIGRGLDGDTSLLSDLKENPSHDDSPPRSRRPARPREDARPRQRHRNNGSPRRTAALINHGRRTVYRRGLSAHGPKLAAGTAVIAVLVTILVVMMSRSTASWPSSVATVQAQIARACENPDVKSEPGQVNFACAKGTRQILWVFALMTSANNPNFIDPNTGRQGLEPISPALGGQIASSLNLHHPYNPANPIDSLQVAARAINNIIGGATVTNASGHPVVQPGLQSHPANCVRYTGSEAVISRAGFPNLCAKPVTRPAGQSALVADIYRKWVVGASPATAQNAAVLFENAQNPGDPRVQHILKHLPNSRPSA
jgi:hypothetical protein